MAIYYIGSFPPSYGGVTIKNKNLYEALEGTLDLRRIDMNRIKRGDIREIVRFCCAMAMGKQYIIGLAGQRNRRQFTKLLYRFKRRAMQNSILVVMSGVVEDMLQAGPDYLRMLSTYRKVYVEFSGMADKLTAAGVTNAAVYPNGRPRPSVYPTIKAESESLQCVFFSQIEPDKGVDRILQTARLLPEVRFHFYGRIVQDYRDAFLREVDNQENVCYHGIFKGSSEEVYAQLSCYDALLLPTRCKTEGLPGILIEAKIAGLPLIVSGINYLKELVEEGVDGFVLPEDTVECLAAAVKSLEEDREKLRNMKLAGRESAEQYYVDVCAGAILEVLREGEKR